jgi:hypothetical protein
MHSQHERKIAAIANGAMAALASSGGLEDFEQRIYTRR